MPAGGKTLYVKLAANIGSFKGEMAAAGASVSRFGAQTDATMGRLEGHAKTNKQAIRSLGTGFGAVGLAAAVGVGIAIKKFADFDKQMSAVQAATHATAGEMGALRKAAIDQGAATQFSAVEAGQGIEELAKAGVSTSFILGGALKGSLDLAAAGALNVGQAAEIAATAMTQFRLKGDRVPHIADLLAAGAGKAQGSVQDLGAALNQSGLVASAMGLSIEDTTGSLAAFASAGLVGSDAGTSFKTMLQRLQAPMGRGAKAMKQYGISAYDTKGNFVGITGVAEQLKNKLGDLTQQQRDAALAQIFGSDAIRAGTVLYRQGGEGIQRWIDKTNDAGYAAETARLRTNNLSGDIERLGGALDSLFIGMGSGANGPMRELVQGLDFLVSAAVNIPGPIKSAGTAALALTAAFGLTVFAATRLLAGIASTRAGMGLLAAQARLAGASMTGFARSMTLMSGFKGAAVIAGMTLAATKAGDGFALSNTAALALMGTMGGPLGVAAGAAVGFIMDVASASGKMGQAFKDAERDLGSQSTFAGQIDGLKALKKSMVDYDFQTDHSLSAVKDRFENVFGGTTLGEEQARDLEKATTAVGNYQFAIQSLEDQTTGAGDKVNEIFDTKKMQTFANEVGPILSKAGLDIQQILSEGPKGEHWGEAVAAINEYRAATDTAAGRQATLTAALLGMNGELTTAAQSADTLAKALSNLFNPAMDADAAVIQMRQSIRDLKTELANGKPTLDIDTKEGAANVTAVQNSVKALETQMSTAAADGAGPAKLAHMLGKGRQAIIDTAVAAGGSRKAITSLLDTYNLTPELVETIIKATGAGKAKGDIGGVNAAANNLNGKTVAPSIQPKGAAEARNSIGSVGKKADEVGRKNAHPKVTPVGVGAALAGLSGILSSLTRIDGYTATSYVSVNKTTYDHGTQASARGNIIIGGQVQSFARGGVARNPRIVRGGQPINQFGEPGTQGESFIPWAKDRRRRATQILSKTAERFGYDLSPRGTQAAGGASPTVIVQGPGNAPLVGALSLTAGSARDVDGALDKVEQRLRKIRRGGRTW